MLLVKTTIAPSSIHGIGLFADQCIPQGTRIYILCSDDTRFFNHAETPNTESREVDGEDEVITVAKRDIQPGEELTDDYRTFEAHVVDL